MGYAARQLRLPTHLDDQALSKLCRRDGQLLVGTTADLLGACGKGVLEH